MEDRSSGTRSGKKNMVLVEKQTKLKRKQNIKQGLMKTLP